MVGDRATAETGLAKVLMPVPDPHPDVFDRQWPLRVGDIDRTGRLRFDAAMPAHPGHRHRTICANWASRRPTRCGSCAAPWST